MNGSNNKNDKEKVVSNRELMSTNDEWHFKVETSPDKEQEVKIEKDSTVKKRIINNNNLTLHQVPIDPTKTRDSLFEKLKNEENQKLAQDIIEKPSLVKRFFAFVFDSMSLYGLYYVAKVTTFLNRFLVTEIMDRYHFTWNVSDSYIHNIYTGFNFFILFSIFIFLPTLFYGLTLGKKLFRIRVRGIEQYTLSLEQVILREMIFRPIAIVSVFGLVMALFNNEHRTLHDMLTKTIVVDDNT